MSEIKPLYSLNPPPEYRLYSLGFLVKRLGRDMTTIIEALEQLKIEASLEINMVAHFDGNAYRRLEEHFGGNVLQQQEKRIPAAEEFGLAIASLPSQAQTMLNHLWMRKVFSGEITMSDAAKKEFESFDFSPYSMIIERFALHDRSQATQNIVIRDQ